MDKEKNKELLLSLGFVPVLKSPDCTLFRKGTNLESVENISYEALYDKVAKYVDMNSRIERSEVEVLKPEDISPAAKEENTEEANEALDDKFEALEDSPFEDVEIESDQYTYLAEEFKKVPLPVLRRISYQGNRYYYEVKEAGVELYSSGTTLISDGYVNNNGALNQWKLKQRILGNDPDAIASERADFGTIMHLLFGHIFLGKKIPFSVNGIKRYVSSIEGFKMDKDRIKYIMDRNAVEMLEDLRSFLKWVKDYNVKPLAIELMLRSEEYMVATAVDLICELDYKTKERGFFGRLYQRKSGDHEKGDPMEEEREVVRRIVAVVDYKSNRSGDFYPEHALQLELNRRIIEENFEDILNIEALYNFSPKSWGDGKKPYHFRERSDDRELLKADCVFEQGRITHSFKEPVITCYMGVASTEDFEIDSCIKTIPLKEYLSDPVNSIR